MKLASVALAILFWTNSTQAQSPEISNLVRVIEEQGREIETLKAQIARIEQIIGKPAISTVAYTPPVQAPAAATPAPAGFRFSGDLRFRFDAGIRGATPQIPGLQNIRGRYRVRFNADRDVSSDLGFHLQMSTGAVNNGLTFDQDFAGSVTRHPFFISEAYVDYHPRPNINLRGGRVEEVYADNFRFLWDDDVRFNGFNERFKVGRIEFRAGQYFLVHPNVFAIPASSPLTLAGQQPGKIARASQMFHQGMTFDLTTDARHRQQLTTDLQLYRNPNLIALTSNATGVTATVAPAIGLTLAAPAPGTGNATTSPSSTILFAPRFQIVRASYRFDSNGLKGNPKLPLTWSVQVARNVGTSQLRDGVLTSISLGRTTQTGDIRALYSFGIKDANSLISQFTDDDFGTGVGVNIAVQHFRLDYTVRPGISLQNLLFLQNERRSSNPDMNFFVPLGRETPRTWRYQGQLAIGF